jgi:hypothetical protein
MDQNLVGASSPQADLTPAMIAFTLLLCMKNKQKPTKNHRARYLGVAMHKDEVLSKEECDALVGRTLPVHRHIWS